MRDLSTQSLIIGCVKGDRGAWNKFIERFSRLIFWAIKEKLNRASYHYNQQDLEDIFQNVFILLWEKGKLKQIKNRRNISGWLAMVAANCAVNHFRGKKEELFRNSVLEKSQTFDCDLSEVLDQENLNKILEKVFGLLSRHERIILKLCYLHDKTHQEIAELLNMPVNTVSSTIKRSKESLRKKLEKEEYKDF